MIDRPSISFDEKVRWILDGGITGVVPGPEMSEEEIPGLIREAKGAGHQIPAVEAPGSGSRPATSGSNTKLPSLHAIDEQERRYASESCLKSIELAEQYEIEVVILSSRKNASSSQLSEYKKVIEEIQIQRNRLGTDRRDPQIERWHQQLDQQQRDRLQTLNRSLAPHPGLQQKRQDSLLRTLDAILEKASRCQIHIGLRETAEIDGLPTRTLFEELSKIFQGAPLGLISDPAAAMNLALLTGQEISSSPIDLQPLTGLILRDFHRTDPDRLLGEGELDLQQQFGDHDPKRLRIVETPSGTDSARIQEVARFCRENGLDGNPPPVAGEPFPIIGGS